ncbi:SHOCT domain-containing protein [Lacisediminihabitans sp. FW035]
MGFEADGFSTSFGVIFGIVTAVVVIGIVISIAVAIRNAARVRNSGHDPLTLQSDLAVKLLDSEALAPAKSLESRLLELDALLAKGTISKEEHAAARARLLGS